MSSPSDDSRLPKKQRLRDEAPPDAFDPPFLRDSASMDCDNHDPILPSISYKDNQVADSEVVDAAHACPKGPIKVVPEEAYGPCMLVEQKQRRPPKNVRPATPPSRSVPPQES
ncbi:hypothetical protein V6N13_029703 [Hibiscus sabdariffa]